MFPEHVKLCIPFVPISCSRLHCYLLFHFASTEPYCFRHFLDRPYTNAVIFVFLVFNAMFQRIYSDYFFSWKLRLVIFKQIAQYFTLFFFLFFVWIKIYYLFFLKEDFLKVKELISYRTKKYLQCEFIFIFYFCFCFLFLIFIFSLSRQR